MTQPTTNERENPLRESEHQELEDLHRALFGHPDWKTWRGVRSLAQPSFLKKIDSFGGPNSGPIESPETD